MADPDGDRLARGGLAEKLEQYDVLLERLEEGAYGGVEAVAVPGQVGGAPHQDPFVGAVVGHRVEERLDDGLRRGRHRVVSADEGGEG